MLTREPTQACDADRIVQRYRGADRAALFEMMRLVGQFGQRRIPATAHLRREPRGTVIGPLGTGHNSVLTSPEGTLDDDGCGEVARGYASLIEILGAAPRI